MSDPQRIARAITNITDWAKTRLQQIPIDAWPAEVRYFLNRIDQGASPTPPIAVAGFFGRVFAFQTSTEQATPVVAPSSSVEGSHGAAVAAGVNQWPSAPSVTALATTAGIFINAQLSAVHQTSWTTEVLDWADPQPDPEIPLDNSPPTVTGWISESMLASKPNNNADLGSFLINA